MTADSTWWQTRRSFLRRAGATLGVGLGGLPLLGPSASAATLGNKRLLVVFTPDGTIHDRWRPVGSQTDFELPQILAPLDAFKDQLLVLDGVNRTTQGSGDGHEQGMTQMLTGRGNLSGETKSTGPSVDAFVNDHIGEGRPVLRLGVLAPSYTSNWTRMTFAENGNPLGVESDPYQARDDIFAGFSPDPAAPGPSEIELRRTAIRGSALSYSTTRMSRLVDSASAIDRDDLLQHLAALEDLANDAPDNPNPTAACTLDRVDAWEAGIDPDTKSNYPAITRMQLELVSAAFACDRARVAVLQFGQSNSEIYHTWADADAEHHGLSHYEFGYADPFRSDALARIYEWHATQLAWLVGDLAANGLLQDTLILWMSEMGAGSSHSSENVPMVLIGSAGGHFNTGQYVDYRAGGGVSHCDVLTSVCNAMGIEIDAYGETAAGPLTGVT